MIVQRVTTTISIRAAHVADTKLGQLSFSWPEGASCCAHAPPERQNINAEIEILSGIAAECCDRRSQINARGKFSVGDNTLIVLT